MNRAIKFRVFDGVGMYFGGFSIHATGKFIDESWYHEEGQEYPVMQFTGLCDVKGVEVYEDDIVYVAGLGNAVVRTACHCGVFYETADDYQTYSDCAAEGDYPTVIGNIHQHPELLK